MNTLNPYLGSRRQIYIKSAKKATNKLKKIVFADILTHITNVCVNNMSNVIFHCYVHHYDIIFTILLYYSLLNHNNS